MKNIFKVNNKFEFVPFIVSILISLGGGLLIGYFIKDSLKTYVSLTKPVFSPPGWVFGIVWPILYILIGIALYRVYLTLKHENRSYEVLVLYIVQLLLNFSWPIIFFTLRLYGISALIIIILIVLIILCIIKFMKIDKVSSVLLVPYLLWCIYASYLNVMVWILNEM